MDGHKQKLKLGTMIRGGEKTERALERFLPLELESLQIFFWDAIPDSININWMDKIVRICSDRNIQISTLGLYANPLRDDQSRIKAHEDWMKLLNMAREFSIPVVSGFTGRIPDRPVEESYEAVQAFYTPVAEQCLAGNLKLAFENCAMDGDRESGDWNIAFLPEAWEVLFRDMFPQEEIGLEFDPAHLVLQDLPAEQLAEKWVKRIHHIHGKDADKTLEEFRFPGEAGLDWPGMLQTLKTNGYPGTIDLEGYHGRFVSHDEEVARQKNSLDFLKQYR